MAPMKDCIYLDYHATTPVDERVLDIMRPFFLSEFGNPSSTTHPFGWRAQSAVDNARRQVAISIKAHPTEIIFTSGATESTNTAIKGLFIPKANVVGRHIVTSSIEHSATLSTCRALIEYGIGVSLVKPRSDGLIDINNILDAMTPQTVLVSLFLVHNELGTINDIKKIAKAVKDRGVLFHCDAAQAIGRVDVDAADLGVDFMSFSGHKIYGPKGIGCLYVRKDVLDLVCPLMHGGGQEWRKRSGTMNVPGIVGMGEAMRIACSTLATENQRLKMLRDRLLQQLSVLDGLHVNGTLTQRVGGNLNVSFAGIDGEELVLAICNRVAISTGSACSSSSGRSRVLEEIGLSHQLRQASIRFGLGRFTTEDEIDEAATVIVNMVKKLTKKNTKTLVTIGRRA